MRDDTHAGTGTGDVARGPGKKRRKQREADTTSPEDRALIVDRWAAGESHQDLAEEFGFPGKGTRIYDWARRLGKQRPPELHNRSTPPAAALEVFVRLDRGERIVDIARALQLHRTTIVKWRKNRTEIEGRLTGQPLAAQPAPEPEPFTLETVSRKPQRGVRRGARPIVIRYACPHCDGVLPAPPRQLSGLVVSMVECPSCRGQITL